MTARIIAPDADGAGVIFVKGDNVMKGYFKNPEATAEAIDGDGWLCTGDIGTIDSDGFIYLRGRDKNMLLGPSGQNIYPEEIEQVLNNLPYVNESLIVSDADHRLVALIHPDYDLALKSGLAEAALKAAMAANLVQLNKDVPAYSRVSSYRLMAEEFEKTPKRSIKRFLYQA